MLQDQANNYDSFYGLAFSSDGKYLYASDMKKLYQYCIDCGDTTGQLIFQVGILGAI